VHSERAEPYHRYGYTMPGERADFVDVFVRGDRYSLLAAMTTAGYITVDVVPGSYDGLAFFDFIAEEVVELTPPHSISSHYS
jgi:hypothetical protein